MLADAFFSSSQAAGGAGLTGAIQQASRATGTSFEYLLAAAKIESNLNPGAKASTSSARGLFQFIEQTWLGTVKEAGGALGYGRYAQAIERLPSGRYVVDDPSLRSEILKLRDDPAASAAMAGVLTQSNSFKLTGALGRRPTDGELYIAHFLGVGGAAKLIRRAEADPQASAAGLFPSAASANRSIFYDRRSGRARSLAEVYGVLTGKYTRAARTDVVQSALAAAGASSTNSATMGAQAQAMAFAGQTGVSTTGVAAPVPPNRPVDILPPAMRSTVASANERVFHSLFHAGARKEAVSPAVESMWSNPRIADASQSTGLPLDLFSDRSGKFAG